MFDLLVDLSAKLEMTIGGILRMCMFFLFNNNGVNLFYKIYLTKMKRLPYCHFDRKSR